MNMRLMGVMVSAVLCVVSAEAAVRLPKIFGDNMVLQCDQSVPVWGWADPNEKVVVEFAGQRKETVAAADGKWMVKLAPLKATDKPAVFKVTGANEVVFQNVVVGEVWFASGQSNMEWIVRNCDNGEQEVAAANFPMIRHFKAPKNFKPEVQSDVDAKWEVTTPETIPYQSAVAYFFGRRIHQALKVPVGLINSSWGGTRIEPWTPPCGFDGLPALEGVKQRVDTATPGTAVHQKTLADYVAAMKQWMDDAQKLSASGKPLLQAAPEFPQYLMFPMTQGKHQEPTVLYNGMVAGLVPFAIRGAIWYQGCSNNGEGMLYLEKTKALVNGWRKVWGQGDFPYYLVQLAPYTYGGSSKSLPGIWEAQAAVPAAIPNTGYTVINDIGNIKDIHPRNKQDVGLRMANQALTKTYHVPGLVWSGPVYQSYAVEGSKIRIQFTSAEGLKTRDGQALTWFELAGPDGQFREAQAVIEGTTVVLSHPSISQPISARFAWDQVAEPNLVNAAGLPTGAFRCGDLPKLDGVYAAEALKGFRKVYEIDLPAQCTFNQNPPQYNVDESARAGAFSRVAYVLQLEDQGGSVQYVATVMDAFTANAKQLAIPHGRSGIKYQMKVANLTVCSNVEGVPALVNSDGGNIEFWPTNYGTQNGLGLPNANATKYDFDDHTEGDNSGYGCMQVHAWKNKTVLFAFNAFNGGAFCDIGIGNNAKGEHADYTFMGNGGTYKTRRLAVFVK